jgi:cyclase
LVKTRVIPCLLLKGEGLVKTIRFREPTYIGDPINAIKIFNEKEVDELIVLDVGATLEKRGPPFDKVAELSSECFMPLGYGGGIRRLDDIRSLFAIGVEKVILNTIATESAAFVESAVRIAGSQSIVASIDVRSSPFGRYEVYGAGGTKRTGLDPVSFAQRMAAAGAGEIFLNSMDRDGTGKGFDVDLIRMVSDSVNIPVIACGGAGTLEHLRQAVVEGRASAVAAGSMFVFHGRHRAVLISYPSHSELEHLFT